MTWIICFSVSVALLLLSIIISAVTSRRKSDRAQIVKPITVLFVGTFLSAVAMFIPVYAEYFEHQGQVVTGFKTFVISVHNTIRLFVIDSDFDLIHNSTINLGDFLSTAYPILACVLFVFAPLLTFSFIMSFFKNVAAYAKYLLTFKKDAYVFSNLNLYSVTLAKDVYKNHKNAVIIFTDVKDSEDEDYEELLEEARKIGAILFRKELTLINFNFHSKKSKILFFILNRQENENVNGYMNLVKQYYNRDLTEIFLFSMNSTSDMVISSNANSKIKVRRINSAQAVIYRNLYDRGEKIFETALPVSPEKKVVSAVIIGLGNYGSSLTKALSWFCQMDGYTLKINVFDENEKAESIFSSTCPELMSEEYNGVIVPGESEYSIKIHSGINYKTKEFDEEISKINDATFVFVCVGSDEANIACAVKTRMLFERVGVKPLINAVVYNAEQTKALENATNFKGQGYDIDYVGDVQSTYSEAVIIDSELEQEALERHKKYGNEEDFWRYEYNYRSSTASAIHMRTRIKCKIPGADKKEEQLTKEEADLIEVLEHKRWNAYMRSEGYVHGDRRNDLAKVHHNLVCFDDLSEEDKLKDRIVGSK